MESPDASDAHEQDHETPTSPNAQPAAREEKSKDLLRIAYEKVREKILKKNYDYVTVISGYEGSGKSTLAIRVAYYSDPDFNGTRVAFTGDELLGFMADAPRGSAIIFDEAAMGLFNRESMSKMNRAITTAAMIARAKNYHLILCIPSFWVLDAYFRDHRARCWIDIERRGDSLVHVPIRHRYRKDTFWEPVMEHHFSPIPADHPIWAAYEARKMAFIDRTLREVREKQAEKKAAKAPKPDPFERDLEMAQEVADDASFWTRYGYAKRGVIASRFGITAHHARSVAELAKALREEAEG